jgi:hypothetical protein
MFHAPSIIISINRGLFHVCLASEIISSADRDVSHATPSLSQHSALNSHVKNKWFLVSSTPELQVKHEKTEPMLKCLRRSMSLVLSLSTSISQAKTLCFMVHLDFQVSPRHLGGWILRKQ